MKQVTKSSEDIYKISIFICSLFEETLNKMMFLFLCKMFGTNFVFTLLLTAVGLLKQDFQKELLTKETHS